MTHADEHDNSTDLAVFNERTAHIAQYPQQVHAAMVELTQDLEAWYRKAEEAGDQQAMTAIQTVYGRAEQMAIISNEQQEALVWVTTIASNLKRQRDENIEALTGLLTALEEVDTDHPVVAQIFEIAEENALESIENNYCYECEGIHTDNPGGDIVENGHLPGVDADGADLFVHIVMGYTDELPGEMYARLAEFINEFTSEAAEYWQADLERRVELTQRQQQEVAHGSR
jgi:hypothetical protein